MFSRNTFSMRCTPSDPALGGEGALYQGADRTGNLCYIFSVALRRRHGSPWTPASTWAASLALRRGWYTLSVDALRGWTIFLGLFILAGAGYLGYR